MTLLSRLAQLAKPSTQQTQSTYLLDTHTTALTHKVPQNIIDQYPTYKSLMTLSSGKLRPIFSESSLKFDKGDVSYTVKGVYLAPSTDVQGINTCKFAGKCKHLCLKNTGNMKYNFSTRELKTLALYLYPTEFIAQLITEIRQHANVAKANNSILMLRLNGTSDILWEDIIDMKTLVDDINREGGLLGGFYDYTKYPLSKRPHVNHEYYHLTFSYDEKKNANKDAQIYIQHGLSVAMVLDGKDIKQLNKQGIEYIDGDTDDFRFLDKNQLVVLKYKRPMIKTDDGYKTVEKNNFIQTLSTAVTFIKSIA